MKLEESSFASRSLRYKTYYLLSSSELKVSLSVLFSSTANTWRRNKANNNCTHHILECCENENHPDNVSSSNP